MGKGEGREEVRLVRLAVVLDIPQLTSQVDARYATPNYYCIL
jgi:hypothetical protein